MTCSRHADCIERSNGSSSNHPWSKPRASSSPDKRTVAEKSIFFRLD
jgi:hypothetical protein